MQKVGIMPDEGSVIERLVRVETLLNGMATRADLLQLQEKVMASIETTNKFIELKSYHNDLLETRVRGIEEAQGHTNVRIEPVKDLENRVREIEKGLSSLNAKMTMVATVGAVTLGAVVKLLVG